MASVLSFDELNRLGYERRSEEYDEYFSDMGLTKAQKEERIKLAESFEKELMPVFVYLGTLRDHGVVIDEDDASERFSDAYVLAVGTVIAIDSEVQEMADDFGRNVSKSTVKHSQDPWYFSEDRIVFDSENESETAWNKIDYDKAVMAGKTHKQWMSKRDKYVRKTHKEVDDVIKKINEPFLVGDSLMMYPKDTSYGADASEIVNCRCIVKYF